MLGGFRKTFGVFMIQCTVTAELVEYGGVRWSAFDRLHHEETHCLCGVTRPVVDLVE